MNPCLPHLPLLPKHSETDHLRTVSDMVLACRYDVSKDLDLKRAAADSRPENKDIVFRAGHSRRIWAELYKVIDSSDIVIQVRMLPRFDWSLHLV